MGLIIAGLLCGAGLTTVVAGLLTIVAWMLTGDDGGNRVGRFAVALRLAIFSRESLGPAVRASASLYSLYSLYSLCLRKLTAN